MVQKWDYSTIKNFNINTKHLRKGTTKYNFSKYIYDTGEKHKVLEVNIKTGKVTTFKEGEPSVLYKSYPEKGEK